MGIVADANVPNLVIQLNLMDRAIVYGGLMKTVPDEYWDQSVRPQIYPVWDTEKDRLVEFTWYDNNTYHCIRRKHIKNFRTGEYEWRDYEMEQSDVEAARVLAEFLKDTFVNIERLQNAEFQEEMGRMYGEVRTESWLSIRLARNFLLSESDYIFCSDVTVSDETKEMYRTYRQKLRDLPATFKDVEPKSVRFPLSPDAYINAYQPANPDNAYLETEDQWNSLSSFFLTKFREKMAAYLSVKEISDHYYMHNYVSAMKNTPVGDGSATWVSDHENLDSIKAKLDELLDTLDGGGA